MNCLPNIAPTKKKRCVGCDPGKHYHPECKVEQFGKVADHLIANGVTVQSDELLTNCKQPWIPVSKQKPEENKNVRFYVDGNLTFTTVLVSGEEKGVRIANRVNVKPCGIHYLDEHATNGWEWSVGNEDVTHWMPLPQPPK